MSDREPLTKTSKITLAILGVLVIALVGGYLGAGLRGGGASASAAAAGNGAFLEKIRDQGELRVGVAIAPPMTTVDADGNLGGPNLIPLEELAAELEVELVPVAAEWETIVAGLQADRYDFAANLDATVERAVAIQFTDPVYEYQGVFVVEADAPVTTSQEVLDAGKPIAAAAGSAPEAALENLGADVLSVDNYTNAVATVQAGRAIAEFTDLPTAESQAQAEPNLKIIVPDPPIYSATANYGVPEDIDARSLQTVNIAIQKAQDSGVLAQAYADVDYYELEFLPAELVKN